MGAKVPVSALALLPHRQGREGEGQRVEETSTKTPHEPLSLLTRTKGEGAGGEKVTEATLLPEGRTGEKDD